MSLEKSVFGTTPDNKTVEKYTVTNKNGLTAEFITYGATIQSITVPCRDGVKRDVTIGFDTLDGHIKYSDYQGNTVGRYANRLHNASFCVGDKKYSVTANEKDKTCLHGGGEFSKAVWEACADTDNSIVMSYTSKNGSNGFPGEMKTKVRFTLTDENKIVVSYTAICSADTPINLTNHTYFNLSGDAGKTVLSHSLKIDADSFTPTDCDSIPTGEIRSVKDTAFDFTVAKPIGRDINENDEQLVMCRGYDHNFCLNDTSDAAASVYEESTGITLNVYTDLPGVQLYTGNFLDGTVKGKGGVPMIKHSGFCLETQYYPDTPNQPSFPQCTFREGEIFRSTTVFEFIF